MSTYQSEQFPIPTPGRLRRELRLRPPPWWMVLLLIAVIVGTWIPLGMIYRARASHSRLPRLQLVFDLDKQPRRGPQSSHAWFQDGRAMRLPVDGTIARGQLQHNEVFFRGFARISDSKSGLDGVHFATEFPPEVPITPALLERGRERYQIFCAVCHGTHGLGDGPVHLRAVELQEPKWVAATNLMTADIRQRSDGQLFQAIRDGVRNMPAYGSQIDARDRWAIVAWVRELQSTSPVSHGDQNP